MTALVLGLLLFLGLHSIRIVAEPWRRTLVARLGERRYRGLYTLLSFVGLGLIVWGYGIARQAPLPLWTPLPGMRHLAALLMLVSFVLLVAAYVPGNAIKARLGHPMLLATKVWAFAHLLANHTLADLLLFGGFLVWAVLCFRAARRRDRAAGVVRAPGRRGPTAVAVLVGLVAWALFAFWGHAIVIGVRPW